jgi:hypothetical protein
MSMTWLPSVPPGSCYDSTPRQITTAYSHSIPNNLSTYFIQSYIISKEIWDWHARLYTPYIIQSDSELLSGFPWPIILKPEKIKKTAYEIWKRNSKGFIACSINTAACLWSSRKRFLDSINIFLQVLCLPAPFRCRTQPVSWNCFNQRRIALPVRVSLPYWVL